MTKRKGERESPCRIPIVGVKGWEGTPLTRMEKKDEEVSCMIQAIQVVSKPKALRREHIYFQLIPDSSTTC
jgi:hypothetical protein